MDTFIFILNILYLVIMMTLVSLNIKYGNKSPIYEIFGIIIISILILTVLSYAILITPIIAI